MGNVASDNGSVAGAEIVPPLLSPQAQNSTPADDSTNTRQLRVALHKFYKDHNPANTDQIDGIVAKFAGCPNVLETELRKKYGASLHDYGAAVRRDEHDNDSGGGGEEGNGSTSAPLLRGDSPSRLEAFEANTSPSGADGREDFNEEGTNVPSDELEGRRRRSRSRSDSHDSPAVDANETALWSSNSADDEIVLIDPEQEEVAALSRRVALLKLRARHHVMGKELALVQAALQETNPEVLRQASSMLRVAAAPDDSIGQSANHSSRPQTMSSEMDTPFVHEYGQSTGIGRERDALLVESSHS